jgi:hypothetical protein
MIEIHVDIENKRYAIQVNNEGIKAISFAKSYIV